jgi:hypothetical protein
MYRLPSPPVAVAAAYCEANVTSTLSGERPAQLPSSPPPSVPSPPSPPSPPPVRVISLLATTTDWQTSGNVTLSGFNGGDASRQRSNPTSYYYGNGPTGTSTTISDPEDNFQWQDLTVTMVLQLHHMNPDHDFQALIQGGAGWSGAGIFMIRADSDLIIKTQIRIYTLTWHRRCIHHKEALL